MVGRCSYKDSKKEDPTEARCRQAVMRIVGHCLLCQADFCGDHRLPETHDCSNFEDCRQEAFMRNKAKLETERTVATKIAAV